jgi:hypothetical protein
MDAKTSQFFHDYISADELIKKFKINQNALIIRAMRKHVTFYYAVKSDKQLTYFPAKSVNTFAKSAFTFLRTSLLPFQGLDERSYEAGRIIPIRYINDLNALGTNTLSELAVLAYCYDTTSVNLRYGIWNKYHPIYFKDVLISIDDAMELRQILVSERQELEEQDSEHTEEDALLKPKTKQTKREEAFLTWLQGKDEEKVSNIKKEEVWEELQQMDRQLFSVEPKNFFRDQKIITFKSGRKSS